MFLPMRRSNTLEDRSPYGDFWFEPISVRTAAGLRVSSDAAMRLAAVYACVSLLAKTFAVAPFKLYQPRADGGRDERRDHWLYKLIAKRPNRFQNPFMWRQMLMGHLALRGNAYNRIYTDSRGVITDLIPQHPDWIRAELLPKRDGVDTGEYRYVIRHYDGSEEPIARGEIWHLRWLSADGIVGVNPIEYARETIGIGLASQEYGARFFANDASPTRGWIEFPGRFKDGEAKKLFQDGFQNAQTGRNLHRTPVLEQGMKFHDVGVKNSDAQFLESRKFSVTEVARIFGCPPHLIGDLDRSTNNNIEQQSLEYLLYTMTPIAEAWEASIGYELLFDDDELDPEFDMQRLLRGDQTSRANFNQKMFGIGAYSINDIIRREGGNPIPGGDQRFVPVNMMPLRENMPSPGDSPAPDDQPETDETGEPLEPTDDAPGPAGKKSESRLAALVQSAVDRIARKEIETVRKALKGGQDVSSFYEKHADFVAAALGISKRVAFGYCAEQLAKFNAGKNNLSIDVIAMIESNAKQKLTILALGDAA